MLLQDYADETTPRAWLLRLVPDGDDLDDYVVEGATSLEQVFGDGPVLPSVLGLDRDDEGNLYFATADDAYVPLGHEYPDGSVRLVKVDPDGGVLFNVGVGDARVPMRSSTGRITVGGGHVALIHGILGSDNNHQMAVTRVLDAESGDMIVENTMWVSHSFDMRLLYDGSPGPSGLPLGFMELQLGDGFPRAVVAGRAFRTTDEDTPIASTGGYPLFYIKGGIGRTQTRTRLGNLALIEEDEEYRYLGLFVAERTSGTEALEPGYRITNIAGIRDLALVRLRRDFDSVEINSAEFDQMEYLDQEGAFADSLTVHQQGYGVDADRTNRGLLWLTDNQEQLNYWGHAEGEGAELDGAQRQRYAMLAERPKLIGIGGDRYVVLYELWSRRPLPPSEYYDWWINLEYVYTFLDVGPARDEGPWVRGGTWGMMIDAQGNTLVGATRLSDSHLPRGDDAFAIAGGAGWLTGDSEARTLTLHLVDDSLAYRTITIE